MYIFFLSIPLLAFFSRPFQGEDAYVEIYHLRHGRHIVLKRPPQRKALFDNEQNQQRRPKLPSMVSSSVVDVVVKEGSVYFGCSEACYLSRGLEERSGGEEGKIEGIGEGGGGRLASLTSA